MLIYKDIFQEILSFYPQVPPENGGILGQRNGIICAYLHDTKIQSIDCAIYAPDVDWINRCIQEWEHSGIEFAGIVHSHPLECPTLSVSDRAYISQILTAMPPYIEELFFPVLIPGDSMHAYRATLRQGTVEIQPDQVTYIARNIHSNGVMNNGTSENNQV